jgi:hypothetical protein
MLRTSMTTKLRHHALLSLHGDFVHPKMAYDLRTKNAKGREERRLHTNTSASGVECMDGIVAASNDTGEDIRHFIYIGDPYRMLCVVA